jgi:hypothetical protein
MKVKCKKCKRTYERFNSGDYGYPYLCNKCKSKINPRIFILLSILFIFGIGVFI